MATRTSNAERDPAPERRKPQRALFVALFMAAALGAWFAFFSGPEDREEPSGGDRENQHGSPVEATFTRLRTEAEASGEPPDPWVLAHLHLALPRSMSEPRSPSLPTTLIDRWGIEGPHGITFPLLRANARGEQHPDLVLKVLIEVRDERGVGPSPERLASIVRAAVARFRFPTRFQEWNDTAWLLHGLSIAAGNDEFDIAARLRLGGGERTLEELAIEALAVVERLDAPVEAALGIEPFTRPSGNLPPDEAGMWAATCGGQHLLQAVVVALRDGVLPAEYADRVAARLEVLRRRVEAETAFREAESRRAAEHGVPASMITRRRVESLTKLHGHALETFALAFEAFDVDPTVADRDAEASRVARDRAWTAFVKGTRERVLELLAARLHEVDPRGTVIPKLREQDPLQWEFWFGDGCHALHGLGRIDAVLERSE